MTACRPAADGSDAAAGLVTHISVVPPGATFGTTENRAIELAAEAGLTIRPVLAVGGSS